MYAKFTDSPSPDSETVTQGSVELENRNPDPPTQASTTAKEQAKPPICGSVFRITTTAFLISLVVLLAFTIANLYLVLNARSVSYLENSLSRISKTSKAKLIGRCPVFYQGSCFFVHWRDNTVFNEGAKICKSNGGLPANIYSKLHFISIKALLKRTHVGKGNSIWTGMTFNATSGRAFYANRTEVQFDFVWYRHGYPIDNPSKDQLSLRHHFDTKYDGFINSGPEKLFGGVLCEIGDRD